MKNLLVLFHVFAFSVGLNAETKDSVFPQALKDPSVMLEAGINWLIHGTHGAKLSLGLQNRPVFENNSLGQVIQTMRKNMLVLQYQIAF